MATLKEKLELAEIELSKAESELSDWKRSISPNFEADKAAADAALLGLDKLDAAPRPTHPFAGSGDACAYAWPDGDEPSEPCGLARSEHRG